MMFLQFFMWSAWYVTMGPYLREVLAFTPRQIGWVYNATAVAAMISPFVVGMVADRFFSTERVMACLHLVGAGFLFAVSRAAKFEVFYPLLIGHTLCFMPTVALANTLAMKQMSNPGKQFPHIALLGTIGWIAAGQLLNLFQTRAMTTPMSFQLAAGVGLIMAGYALTLPHTPPKDAGRPVTVREVLGLDALRMLKDRSFAVFVITAFLFCIPLTLYWGFATMFLEDMGTANVVGTMTLGQASQIIFMLLMPLVLGRLGVKWVFVLALLGWASRYFLFHVGYEGAGAWSLYLGVAMHGVCYVFFFVLAYIYVDRKAPEAIRTRAQGFISLVTLGLGFFVGSIVAGWTVQQFSFPNAEPTRHRVVGDARRWIEGGFVKWDTANGAAYGKVTGIDRSETDAAQWSAVVEVFDRTVGAYAASGRTQMIPLSGASRPMTLWGKVWLAGSLSCFVMMVPFLLVFRHERQRAERRCRIGME